MPRERRNKIHKQNKQKKKMSFFDTKVSFISGIVFIMSMVHDTISLITTVPIIFPFIEVLICITLVILALITNKLDLMLHTDGVEKFGSYLTLYSIFVFMFQKLLLSQNRKNTFEISITNDNFILFVVFSLFELFGVIFAICLLLDIFPQKRN